MTKHYKDTNGTNQYYKNRINEVYNAALDRYKRLCIVRVDLRYPDNYFSPETNCDQHNLYIAKFTHSLTKRVRRHIKNKTKINANKFKLYYCWVTEFGDEKNKKHYHLLLFLPKDVFYNPGKLGIIGGDNLHTYIRKSWATALGIKNLGLPTFPGFIHINKNNPDGEAIKKLCHHRDYLSKNANKQYGSDFRSFGCSQINS